MIMTPKEEAQELVDKYNRFDFNTIVYSTQRNYAKQCALIAVGEVIKKLKDIAFNYDLNLDLEISWNEQVKTEIEKL